MKSIFLILSLSFTCSVIGQVDSIHPPRANGGFTSKAEAKNLISNGLKVGKWLEYLDENENVIEDTTKISDTGIVAKYYRLTIYNRGMPEGLVRYYYKYSDGEEMLFREIPHANGKINGVYREYYPSGALHREYPFTDGLENGLAKDYWEDGNVKDETKYTNGKAGATKSYDEDGKEIK